MKFITLFLLLLLVSCTKRQLKQVTMTVTNPVENQTFYKNDSVFVKGEMVYEKKIKNIGFFCAMVNDANDSTFFKRTILPGSSPFQINEYYLNEFNDGANVTLSYGKRNIKTGQIYEIQTVKLKFLP